MKLNVPFVYVAEIIKPRCRIPVRVYVRDTTTVNIKAVDSLPVAMRAEGVDYLWHKKKLWTVNFERVHEYEPRRITLDEVKSHTEDGGVNYKFSRSTAAAPFKCFWRGMDQYGTSGPLLNNESIINKEDLVYRELVSDTRNEEIQRTKDIASSLISVDNIMYKVTGEPRYYALTFGLGGNHASTNLFISTHYNPNIVHRSYFSALQYEEACKYTSNIAANRGDTKSLPIKTDQPIQVFIKEAVQLNPKRDHGVI